MCPLFFSRISQLLIAIDSDEYEFGLNPVAKVNT